MLIKEIMKSDLDVVAPGQPLTEAAKKMRDDDVGALPVRGRTGGPAADSLVRRAAWTICPLLRAAAPA